MPMINVDDETPEMKWLNNFLADKKEESIEKDFLPLFNHEALILFGFA
jgi:hypothetical protein